MTFFKEIVRDPKVFKPLVIPKKLQHALPYRDKPNHGVKMAERKKKIDRVAVIKEPYEQKVRIIPHKQDISIYILMVAPI